MADSPPAARPAGVIDPGGRHGGRHQRERVQLRQRLHSDPIAGGGRGGRHVRVVAAT
jgi:hypothetical protein